MISAWVGPMAAGVLLLGGVVFEDPDVRFEVPEDWTVTGESGEYLLESEHDFASLLLLPPDPDRPLDVVLAEIEEQFVSTGQISLEESAVRRVDGDLVRTHRYRFDMAGEDASPVMMHQYSFVRSAVHVLLQVETPPEGADPEPLFAAIHSTLEVLTAPDLFGDDSEDVPDPDAEALPDDEDEAADPSPGTSHEPATPKGP